jgi:tRNA pseudouridine13 synthase
MPQAVEQSAAADELYPGRRKLTLRFSLARGAYATILIKRVTGPAAAEWESDQDAQTAED